MKLTEKCKTDFESWIKTEMYYLGKEPLSDLFMNALIIEFFDSVGIYVDCGHYAKGKFCSGIETKKVSFISTGTKFVNRQEATNEAIIKANKLYLSM